MVGSVDEARVFAASTRKTQRGAVASTECPTKGDEHAEVSHQYSRRAADLRIGGSNGTASEHQMKLRRAYNQWNGPVIVTPPARYYLENNGFGFGGRDPSRVGGEDPSLRPSGS